MNIVKLIGGLVCLIAVTANAAITVQDDDGKTVTLQKPAQRIISLAPHVTELLFAAGGGDLIKGVVSYSDYPEAAKLIPIIGDNREVDIERIIALKPDLLVIWRHGSSDKQVEQLRKLGVPLFYSEPHKLVDIPNNIRVLGQLMGTEKQANSVAAELSQQLTALTAKYANRSPVRLFYQVWDKPLFTLNGQHIVSDAIRVCGGVNIFANLKTTAPNVGIEAVLQEDPEAIIGTAEKSPSDGGVAMWKRYPGMTAVKRANLFLVDGNLINRSGPRMIAGTAALCEKLDLARSNRK
ncbi:cobalamin-binding protein [Solimicrobium silvestre]|uniref:ABC-type Fe3+-hydroxamate transport system periplasmic component n=1 Tax=Solimicrobium silvestre TaxID=2099400 RepID=A0A2S9GUX1_9BURK|nr:cobalamin-binding protein [Solimicrobium silvestre]PRC91532.1 ABC-type Fe3+-hydroxamate transport system periplasmic component [Solimicrobium silvestre]